jgi:hypothetical protein
MKLIYSRRYRRSPSQSREGRMFKKDMQQEQAFFSTPSNQSFFKPNAALQRKCAECEAEDKKMNRMSAPGEEEKKMHKKEEDKELHRSTDSKEKEEEKKMQRKGNKDEEEKKVHLKEATSSVPGKSSVSTYISSLHSKGEALPSEAQHFFGERMGSDFSGVKIHTGTEAEQSAKEVNAKAYTVDNHIIFNKGQYDPGTDEGKKLLAHELTHTLQQSGGIKRKPFNSRPPFASIPIDYDMISDPVERMEMMRADYERYRWKNALERLDNGELDDGDLQYEPLRNRLTGLKRAEVDALITKIKAFQQQRDKDVANPAVKDPEKKKPISTAKIIQWLEVRKEISTPMPDNAMVNSLLPGLIDSYSISFNDVEITVMSDTHGASRNETRPTANFTGNFTWLTVGGKITNLKRDGVPFNPTKLEVKIQTRYKNSPDDTSGYGKGTTDTDKYNKTTTLRVHEGQHGTDFITYLTNTPLPVSLKNGINGQVTPAQFSKLLTYIQGITKDTCESTDQSGFSQDEFLKTPQGMASGITSCRKP